MLQNNFHHGFSDQSWDAAKDEAREVMYATAKRKRTICYSDLVGHIRSIRLEAHDLRLAHFLGEIASEDDDNGMGLTTVVVVHKNGDQQPGPGFFEMAESRGRDVSDHAKCWIDELNAVHDHWA